MNEISIKFVCHLIFDQVSSQYGTYDTGQCSERVRDRHQDVGVASSDVQMVHAKRRPRHATETDRQRRADDYGGRIRAQRGQRHEHKLQDETGAAEELSHIGERPLFIDQKVRQIARDVQDLGHDQIGQR